MGSGTTAAHAAAPSTSDFRVTFSDTTYSDAAPGHLMSMQSVINGLDVNLAKVGLSSVNLNRYGSASECYQNVPSDVAAQFCWDDGDNASSEWYPQGVTTSNDATGGSPTRILTSWYDNCSQGKYGDYRTNCQSEPTDDRWYKKGVRLSVFDTSTFTYRLILLVEPFINASGNSTYKSVKIHAGGIAWYGKYLYVADTDYGFRVFDTTQLFDLAVAPADPALKVNTSDKTQIGRQSGTFYGHGYRYVMPQVGRWTQNPSTLGTEACTESGAVHYSYTGLDRSTTPARLVAGEYCNEDTNSQLFGRVGRFNLTADASTPAGGLQNTGGTAEAVDAVRLLQGHIQGAVSVGSTFYFDQSHGSNTNGTLWKYTLSGGSLSPDTAKKVSVPIGCEDLSYDASGGYLYSVSEYLGGRMAYKVSSF